MPNNTNSAEGIVKAFQHIGEAIIRNMNSEGIPLLSHKIEKWIENDDPDKVADYLVRIFNNNEYTAEEFVDQFVGHVAPSSKEAVEAIPAAMKAIEYLNEKGWKCKLATDYKGMGKQIVIICPDESYWYHSKYEWGGES